MGAEVGGEVFGVASVGGYSEYALLDNPVHKPASLPWDAAAAIVTVGEAGYRVLKHLGLKSGQTRVVLGVGGSVGAIAVQLARSRGHTYPLREAASAHADLEARRNQGKIILRP